MDGFAKNLHKSLEARNLTDIVDIVFVSDHGMTDTSHPEMIYMDDPRLLGPDGLSQIEHEDGWPSMGIRFRPRANVTHYLNTLLDASDANPEKFDVYTHDTMPERFHFSENERIAPIYVIPKIGYALTTKEQGDIGMSKGVSSPQCIALLHARLTMFCCRTTVMTMLNHPCTPCLSHTARSLLSPKHCTSHVLHPSLHASSPARIKDGTQQQTTHMLWIHSRTWRYTISSSNYLVSMLSRRRTTVRLGFGIDISNDCDFLS